MSNPSHRAAAAINKRARQHYPRVKADVDSHATDTAAYITPLAEAAEPNPAADTGIEDSISFANIEANYAPGPGGLDWPIEGDDPWMRALGIGALFVMGLGILTLLGGLGFGVWRLVAFLFHSLD
jgi:hypothetical protein